MNSKKANTYQQGLADGVQHVPLFIIPPFIARWFRFVFQGSAARLNTRLHLDAALKKTDLTIDAHTYIATSFLNALLYFGLFTALFSVLLILGRDFSALRALVVSGAISALISLLILLVFFQYPRILSGKKAEQIDKHLVFAMKDLLLQVSSGVPVVQAFAAVARGRYGVVSDEFRALLRIVNTGVSLEEALELRAQQSSSSYLKRAFWQILNSLRSGSSMRSSLRIIIDELVKDQRARINGYAKELNLWSLIYMLFAVAIPSIGATMLVILSSFAGFGISKASFIGFLGVTIFVQIALIGLVKTRRPVVSL